MLKPVQTHRPASAHGAAAPLPKVIAKNAFTRLYDANQADNLKQRPGWPDQAGQKVKLAGGAQLEALGIARLPRGSKAAQAINAVIKEGVDGDQSAYKLKVGKATFLVVGSFPEDAARDQIWIFDAKGHTQIASAVPNETTGKLIWS